MPYVLLIHYTQSVASCMHVLGVKSLIVANCASTVVIQKQTKKEKLQKRANGGRGGGSRQETKRLRFPCSICSTLRRCASKILCLRCLPSILGVSKHPRPGSIIVLVTPYKTHVKHSRRFAFNLPSPLVASLEPRIAMKNRVRALESLHLVEDSLGELVRC